jgi:hypothetical protein
MDIIENVVAPVLGIFSPGPFVKSPMTRAFRDCLILSALHPGFAVITRQYYDENRAEPFELGEIVVYRLKSREAVLKAFDLFAGVASRHLHELGVAAIRRVSDNDDAVGIPNAPMKLADVRLNEAVSQVINLVGDWCEEL